MQVKIKRGGQVIARKTIRTPAKATPAPKTTLKAAHTIPAPRRSMLTRKGWQEYGDLLRGIKRLVPEYQGLEYLSLQDLREAREGIRRVDLLRTVAQYK